MHHNRESRLSVTVEAPTANKHEGSQRMHDGTSLNYYMLGRVNAQIQTMLVACGLWLVVQDS